jgi:phosphonate C-P lyase system protein PhnH
MTAAPHQIASAGPGARTIFRVLLASAARPGRPQPLGLDEPRGRTLLPLLALAHPGTTFAAVGFEDDAVADVVTATGATPTPLPNADLVATADEMSAPDLRTLRMGTPEEPHTAARLFHPATAFGESGEVRIALEGPGVAGSLEVGISGVPIELLETLRGMGNGETGIDTWFVSADAVVAIPRSSKISVLEGRSSWATQE